MYKYSITNLITNRSFGAKYENKTKGDAWRDQHIKNNTWGLPDRWKTFGFDSNGIEYTPDTGSTQNRQIIYQGAISYVAEYSEVINGQTIIHPEVLAEPAVYITEYFYPQEYTITETDTTKDDLMEAFRALRDSQYQEAKEQINKHLDSDTNAISTEAAWRAYRVALRDATNQFKNLNGSIKVAILAADLVNSLPVKPS